MTLEEIKKEYNNILGCIRQYDCNQQCSKCPYENRVSTFDLIHALKVNLSESEIETRLINIIDKKEKCFEKGKEGCCTCSACRVCEYRTDMTTDEVIKLGIELLDERYS